MINTALARAITLAEKGPQFGPNPRVGCVIYSEEEILAEGFHRGSGSAHAEVAAIQDAHQRGKCVRGATALVTLEPCNHTGKTGPCSHALLAAGISRVIYAQADPNPVAAGGAAYLQSHGIEVATALAAGADQGLVARAQAITAAWRTVQKRGRAWVIAKVAQTLDGKVAASDGTSKWITGPQAREHGHQIRATVDAICVGTGTYLTDSPQLSARPANVKDPHQPKKFVIGNTDLSLPAQFTQVRTHDLRTFFEDMFKQGNTRILLEGGPTLVSAALKEGLVDELHVYTAPKLLGEGKASFADLGITTVADAIDAKATITQLGPDWLVCLALTE